MTKEPTVEDMKSWLDCEPYVAENYLFGPEWNKEIREAILRLISQPPAPKVVTREQVYELVRNLAPFDDGKGFSYTISWLEDHGFIVEKKP